MLCRRPAPQDGMTPGWESEFSRRGDMLPVDIAEVTNCESGKGNQKPFQEPAGAERTLYLRHSKPGSPESSVSYVEKGRHSRKIDIYLDGRDVKTPGKYPWLLLLPLTIPIDAATWPIQLLFLHTQDWK